MPFILAALITLAGLATQAGESPFNSYAVVLDPAELSGGCSVGDASRFQNRTYTFRGRTHDLPLVFRGGKALELNELGRPEWEYELVQQSVVSVDGQSAVILRFVADHVGGTGSWGTILVGTCDDRRLTVVFEAESLGGVGVAITDDDVLVVKHLVWSSADAHCCPSGETEERYRWDGGSRRFARIDLP